MTFKIYRHTDVTGWKFYGTGYPDMWQAVSEYKNLNAERIEDETLALLSVNLSDVQIWFQNGPERSSPNAINDYA